MYSPLKRTNFKLRFLGNSSDKSIDNMFLVESTSGKVLLDCGMYQGTNNGLDVYNMNRRPLQVKYSLIDFIILSGCELENCGLLPRLYQQGCDARICVPTGCKKLITTVLYEALAKIEEQQKIINRKWTRKEEGYRPVYTEADVKKTISRVYEYKYGRSYRLKEGINFRYYHSGYSTSSAQILLNMSVPKESIKIGYTGYIGSEIAKSFVTPRENLPACDVLIGSAVKCSENNIRTKMNINMTKLKRTINETLDKEGNTLIVCPTTDSIYYLLSFLYRFYYKSKTFKNQIIIDNPFAMEIDSYYENLVQKDKELLQEIKEWRYVDWIRTPHQSAGYRGSKGFVFPKIIITTIDNTQNENGLKWIERILQEDKSSIILFGCEDNPLLNQLRNKSVYPLVRVIKDAIAPVCKIEWCNSFNKHADYEELLRYYSNIEFKKLFIVQANIAYRHDFVTKLKKKAAYNIHKSEIIEPETELIYYYSDE